MRVELWIKCQHMAHLFAKLAVLPNHFRFPLTFSPSLSFSIPLSPPSPSSPSLPSTPFWLK